MADCTIKAYIKWSRYSTNSSRIWNNNYHVLRMCVLDCAYVCLYVYILIVFILNLILVFSSFSNIFSAKFNQIRRVFFLFRWKVTIKFYWFEPLYSASRTHFSEDEMKLNTDVKREKNVAWCAILIQIACT